MDSKARQRFTEFVDTRLMGLLRLAYVLTGDQHAAEDLVQTALTKTAARWRQVRDPDSYVRRVMYREQVSSWRRPRRFREATYADPPERGVEDGTRDVDLRLTMEQGRRSAGVFGWDRTKPDLPGGTPTSRACSRAR